jgi:2-oxo-4-hydroxy-4-carboxy-5-ureidoimidazoline decarboxylase
MGELRSCCASRAWAEEIERARPYPDRAALVSWSDAVLAGLDWVGIREAVDAHPRIGERLTAAGTGTGGTDAGGTDAGASREAAWSGREQSGMDSASARTRAALVEANRAYEERFGHVFLIFATGRTDTEMLAAAQSRIGHDEATERDVVRAELARIVSLRLTKLLDALAAGSGSVGAA